jgi:hypothetical protein
MGNALGLPPALPLPLLLLLLLQLPPAAPLAGADAPPTPWSGVISVDETINGPPAVGGAQSELDHYAQEITDRLRQAHAQMLIAPPFIARVVHEDIGFYEAELERVTDERGGSLLIGHTTYFIKGGRMLMVSDGDRILIDRAKGTAQGVVDGQPLDTKLQDEPDLDTMEGAPAGETINGYPTKRVTLKVKGRSYILDIAPGLPNPYRIGLMERDQDDDLTHALAVYQGLPMNVSEASGEATLSLSVVAVDRRAINDRIFRP